LQAKVITPDILVNPHFASLEMFFYTGSQFPPSSKATAFAAEHGSWNRAQRSGYEVIRLPMKNGHATGEYEDFLTGFVSARRHRFGERPVGVAQASDGSLLCAGPTTGSVDLAYMPGSSDPRCGCEAMMRSFSGGS
jgi:glucose/arabinose dehydrogenase